MSTNKQNGLRRSLRLGAGCLFASLAGVAIKLPHWWGSIRQLSDYRSHVGIAAIVLFIAGAFEAPSVFSASQQAATFNAFLEHCEIVSVPLPTGGSKTLLAWKPSRPDARAPSARMARLAQTDELRTITLALRAPPPFLIEVSTNLVDWSFFDSSTNEVATITICAEQQAVIPFAFFRPKPASALARRLWR